jgi:hypothetical protein
LFCRQQDAERFKSGSAPTLDTIRVSVTENVTETAKEIRLDDVKDGDINELLESLCRAFSRRFRRASRTTVQRREDTEGSEADTAMSVRSQSKVKEAIPITDRGGL